MTIKEQNVGPSDWVPRPMPVSNIEKTIRSCAEIDDRWMVEV